MTGNTNANHVCGFSSPAPSREQLMLRISSRFSIKTNVYPCALQYLRTTCRCVCAYCAYLDDTRFSVVQYEFSYGWREAPWDRASFVAGCFASIVLVNLLIRNVLVNLLIRDVSTYYHNTTMSYTMLYFRTADSQLLVWFAQHFSDKAACLSVNGLHLFACATEGTHLMCSHFST